MTKPIALITGSSRGIGKQIALSLAEKGYHIIVCGKTVQPHPKLPSTIYEVVDDIKRLGGSAQAYEVDLRNDEIVTDMFHKIEHEHGKIDILINNASAISLSSTFDTSIKKYDLMMDVNARGTFLCSSLAIPLLKHSSNPHIVTMSPPLNLNPKWLAPHLAYTISKYSMSLCVLGLSAELKSLGIAVNALWPKTIIATAAIEFNFPAELMKRARHPSIVSDAIMYIVGQPSSSYTGQFLIDEDVLKESGIHDFERYALDSSVPLFKDLYLD